jgi:hypothetical protein
MSPLERHELIEPLERVLVVVSHPTMPSSAPNLTIALPVRAGARVDYVVSN